MHDPVVQQSPLFAQGNVNTDVSGSRYGGSQPEIRLEFLLSRLPFTVTPSSQLLNILSSRYHLDTKLVTYSTGQEICTY
jgi:hypothetical protein